MNRFGGAALAVMLAFGVGQPAAATIVDITYSGVVASGADVTGVFGAASDLSGTPFTATFRFDLDASTCSAGAIGTDCVGGVAYGDASPNLGASLEIGGVAVTFVGDASSEISGYNNLALGLNPFSEQSHSATRSDRTASGDDLLIAIDVLTLSSFGSNGALPASVDTPFAADLSAEQVNASFAIEDEIYDPRTGDFVVSAFAYGQLRPMSLVETVEAAVPEPSAWMLMLAGIGAIGGLMRRRRGMILARPWPSA